MEARVLGTSNTNHRMIIGFTNATTGSAVSADTNLSANEAFFRKVAATTATYEAVTRDDSGAEQVTTALGSTTAFTTFRIELDDAAANAKFYINNALVATHSTVPDSTDRLGYYIVNGTTDTTGRNVQTDFFRVWSDDPPLAVVPPEGTEEDEVGDSTPPPPEELNLLNDFVVASEGNYLETDQDLVIRGTLVVDKIIANQIEGLEIFAGQLASLQQQLALPPQQPATGNRDEDDGTTEVLGAGDDSGLTMIAYRLDLSQGLTVGGDAEFRGNSFFYGLVTFVEKTIFRNDIRFEGRPTFNNDTAGFAVIYPTQTEVEVKFDKPYEHPPVVVVSLRNGKFATYSHKDVTTDGFKIVLPGPASDELEFSWIALSVTDARTSKIELPPPQNP
jgi:hypothetical protein